MRPNAVAAFILVLMLAGVSRAGEMDGMKELAAGGLVAENSHGITVQREDLTLSPSKVSVRYEMRNDTARPVTLAVSFQVPDVSDVRPARTVADAARPTMKPDVTDPNLLGFRVWADGQEVTPEMDIRAILPDGRDVSEAIRRIGGVRLLLHPGGRGQGNGPDEVGQDNSPGLDAATRQRLEAIGALEQEDDMYDAKWTPRVTYHWMQSFRPGITILEQAYRPVLGSHVLEVTPEKPLSRLEKQRYCIDRATERAIRSLPRGGDVRAFTLGYMLQTARTWPGSIGTFHLTLQGDPVTTPDGGKATVRLMSLCTDLSLHQTGRMRFEAVAQDYAPAYDLLMLILAD